MWIQNKIYFEYIYFKHNKIYKKMLKNYETLLIFTIKKNKLRIENKNTKKKLYNLIRNIFYTYNAWNVCFENIL